MNIVSWIGPVFLKNNLFSVYTMIKILDDFVVVPMAILSLLIGIVYAIFTKWGFFKYKWIIIKWVLTILIMLTGAIFLGPLIEDIIKITITAGIDTYSNPLFLHKQLLFHIGGFIQSSLLIFIYIISVLKPWGSKTKK